MNTLALSPSPRARILESALACFLESSYEQTTVARICERAGVSNGTLFHYFPTKEAIADALYLEAIADFQDGLWLALGERPRSFRKAVRGVIAHQLDTPLHAYLDDLADAAVAALAGTPAKARRPAPAAREGRLRLELVSEEGNIIGHGEATAQIRAAAPQ